MLSIEQRRSVEALIRGVGQDYILPHFLTLQDDDVKKKSDGTLVTAVDIEAEERLIAGLSDILPDCLFLGEESTEEGRTTICNLNCEDKPVWVVDPIDGTKSFVDGVGNFGTMISLVYRGETMASYMYDICSDSLVSIHKPEALEKDGCPFIPGEGGSIKGEIASHVWNSPLRHHQLNNLNTNLEFGQNTGPRIDSYMKFLRGEIDFLVFEKTPPWDHLAGISMLESMGCAVQRWDGSAVSATDTDKGLVIARSPELMEKVQSEIVQKIAPKEKRRPVTQFVATQFRKLAL